MKDPYMAYAGTVSIYDGGVVSDFTGKKKLNERTLAELLNRAYRQGRRDVKEDIRGIVQEIDRLP